jgi:hypothetical protein
LRTRGCARVRFPGVESRRAGLDAGNGEQVEFLSRFEADGFAGRDADFGTGSRVASDACLSRLDVEYAEAAQFDAVAFSEGVLHGFEDGVNGGFRLDAWEAGSFYDALDEVLLDQ